MSTNKARFIEEVAKQDIRRLRHDFFNNDLIASSEFNVSELLKPLNENTLISKCVDELIDDDQQQKLHDFLSKSTMNKKALLFLDDMTKSEEVITNLRETYDNYSVAGSYSIYDEENITKNSVSFPEADIVIIAFVDEPNMENDFLKIIVAYFVGKFGGSNSYVMSNTAVSNLESFIKTISGHYVKTKLI